ncbi:MAG: hypothetical protein BVN29_18330 [Nitrospira sp. ST-bin5]|nr:MAG: hypothetical protein BVN29_18330 [Nitrospira sp. ST-bin5]
MARKQMYYGPLPDPQDDYPNCRVVGEMIVVGSHKYLPVICKQCPKESAQVRIVAYSRAFIEAGGTLCKSCAGVPKGFKHGMSETRTYARWESMWHRVRHDEYYIKNKIGVEDPDWETFEGFYADMKNIPDDKESIDRIDNNRGYGKVLLEDGTRVLNCRWSDRIEQNNNTSANVFIKVDGERMTVAQAARKYGICPNSLSRRVNEGQNHDEAVRVLVEDRARDPLSEIAQRAGVSYRALWKRIKRGTSLTEALKSLKEKKGKPTIIHQVNAAGVSISAVKHRIRKYGMTLEQAIQDALGYQHRHQDGAAI